MKLTRNRTVLLAALATLLTSAAHAQITSEQQSAMRANCRSDFMSKCSGVSPGGKDALACLQKNVASLSPACKTVVSATLPPPAPPAAAPAAPAAPPPAAAAPAAPAAPAASTAAPAAAPSVNSAPPPRAKVDARRKPAAAPAAPAAAPAAPAAAAPTAEQQAALRSNCRGDFQAKCKGVQPGGKDALACLQKNAPTLSPACKTAVSAITPAAAAVAPAATPAEPPPAAAVPAKRPTVVDAAVVLRACKIDAVRHCGGVEVGGGRLVACLTAHEKNLTIRCRTAMKVTAPIR